MHHHNDLFYQNLRQLAEQQTLLLVHSHKLTPQEVIRQYTGNKPPAADLNDAVNAIYHFNLQEANKNGFVAY